jgi:sugar phosphate isomerase/epimerase
MRVGIVNAPGRALVDDITWVAANGFTLYDVTIGVQGARTEQVNWHTVAVLLREKNLSVICRAGDDLPVENSSPIVRQAALDELRRTLDVAQILGATLCTLPFKGWQAEWNEGAGYEAWKQLLQILVRHGAERGVAVAVENGLNNMHQLKYLREIFKRVPEAGLALDVGRLNINTARGLTRDYLFAFAERLRHVRVGDNDGSADQQLPFGAPRTGGIDLAEALRELKAFGYKGDITLAVAGDRRWLSGCRDLVEAIWAGK